MSDSLKIERGIPMPPARSKCTSWPFADLKVGDSFLVPIPPGTHSIMQARVLQASRRHKANGEEYCSRKVEGGVRVWRTK